ncbi:hypothetical protein [Kitasatospora griseola]
MDVPKAGRPSVDFLPAGTALPTLVTYEVKRRIKNTGRRVTTAKYRACDSSMPLADRTAWEAVKEDLLPVLDQKSVVDEL